MLPLLADVCFSTESIAVVGLMLTPVVAAVVTLWNDGRQQCRSRIAYLEHQRDTLFALLIDLDLEGEANRALNAHPYPPEPPPGSPPR